MSRYMKLKDVWKCNKYLIAILWWVPFVNEITSSSCVYDKNTYSPNCLCYLLNTM